MHKLITIFSVLLLVSCNPSSDKTLSDVKVPVYAWMGGPGSDTDKEIKASFMDLKNKGIIGLLYNGGHDPETYKRVGGIAKEVGLEFHTWIPSMVQNKNPKLVPELYALNGLGESAFDKPAYVDYYKFLCPTARKYTSFLPSCMAALQIFLKLMAFISIISGSLM